MKSDIVTQAKEAVKNKNKETNMKTSKKTILKVIGSVIAVQAFIGLVGYAGFSYGQSYERNMNAHIESQVKAATAKQASITSLK